MSERRVNLLGCPVDVVTLQDAVEKVESYIADGGMHQGVGVNLDQFLKMHKDPEFMRMIERADLITADGQPVVWVSRLLGTPLPERVASIDIFEALLPVSAQKGYRIFLLGARQEAMQAAADAYLRRYPGLKIVGRRDGYFSDGDEPEIVEQINGSGADMLFIAISSPKKEQFVERNREKLQIRFVLGVGGAFDIAAGLITRAPMWMRRIGMEWVWRLCSEPRRMWPRVREDFGFLGVVLVGTVRRQVSRWAPRR